MKSDQDLPHLFGGDGSVASRSSTGRLRPVILIFVTTGRTIFEVEPTDESGGFCACCGNQTRNVWGFVHENGATVAAYFVQWTVGASRAEHPANFDFIYGPWGEGASKDDRCAISLIHFETDGAPGVSVIDATGRSFADDTLVGSVLTREEVIGTPLAPHIFAIFDAVFLQDQRLDG